jgi:hypothetical protein
MTLAAPRFLIALQFWQGDREPAMRLARLLADLEPHKSETVDFLFSARFDCTHDHSTVDYVSRKFNVHKWVNRRRGVGWPHGCNELWLGTIEWVWRMMEARRIPHYKAILNFEADCAPLKPGWADILAGLWDKENTARQGKLSEMGHICENGPDGQGHINGNCIVTGDQRLLRQIVRQVDGNNAALGWDFAQAPFFRSLGWADTPAIRSLYNSHENFTQERVNELRNEGAVFIHGVKNYSLQDTIRKEFLTR